MIHIKASDERGWVESHSFPSTTITQSAFDRPKVINLSSDMVFCFFSSRFLNFFFLLYRRSNCERLEFVCRLNSSSVRISPIARRQPLTLSKRLRIWLRIDEGFKLRRRPSWGFSYHSTRASFDDRSLIGLPAAAITRLETSPNKSFEFELKREILEDSSRSSISKSNIEKFIVWWASIKRCCSPSLSLSTFLLFTSERWWRKQ